MKKIKYSFELMQDALENIKSQINKVEDVLNSFSSLDIGNNKAAYNFSVAKNTTLTCFNDFISESIYNLNKAINIKEEYMNFENSTVSNNEFLNKQFGNTIYTIKAGDTLSKIALKNNISLNDLIKANESTISNKNLIYVGASLIIPGSYNGKSNNVSPTNHNDKSNNTTHSNITETNNNISEKPESIFINNDNSISGSKYTSKPTLGFNVTTDNKRYQLSDSDKDLLTAIVAAECDKSSDDALAVVSTILNRCEDTAWVNSYGNSPISQATAPNQYVVYQEGLYKSYINGKAPESVKNAVNDSLNGVRNCDYLSFRSNGTYGFSSNMITSTGNRYV